MKEPLFRRVNTRTRGMSYHRGGDFRHQRNTKSETSSDASRGPMHGRRRRGRDYTPLFRFLLSKVGDDWDDVFGEAVARLDDTEPIFWMVATHPHEKRDLVRVGESSYVSGLYVDAGNRLRIVDPDLDADSLEPDCACCTHTLNGIPFTKKYRL